MGNSGSVHHMQSGLKELNTYYQVQSNNDGTDDFSSFLKDEQKISDKSISILQSSSNRLKGITSTTKTSGVNNSHHIKVLPSLTENLRLRSTTNGAILHSGGTISGRRESLLLQPLERSRTFIAENLEDCMNKNQARMITMQRRSQTQLDIDLRKRRPNKMLDENVNYKCFSSNLDLGSSMMNDNLDTYSNETYQKLSKVKIRTKKRKAPAVPPLEIPIIDQNNDFERKQRLFKTKTETETTGIHSRQHLIKSSLGEERLTVVMRSNQIPGFRREKSFDAKLLSSEMTRNGKHLQRELNTTVDIATKRRSLQLEKTPKTTSPLVFSKMNKSDLKTDLQVTKKFRVRSMTKITEPSIRQREPIEEKPKLLSPSKANRPENQSKIPQLKKTFYFGMESSKQKPLTTRMLTSDSSRKIVNPPPLEDTVTKKTLSKDRDEVYSLLNHKFESELKHDNGIQLNVRPTLPRRQLEIPRFSPVAAWRTLPVSDEHRKELHPTVSTSPSPAPNAAIETTSTYLVEDRIHRTYRDPCPFYPDNKSGDSGISGDDGYILEKPIQPQNLEHVQNNCDKLENFDTSYPVDELVATPMKVVGPFLTAWTPQQDLDEEDSSSDGGGGEMAINVADSQRPTSAHVFSLSLPRENQLAAYGEKNNLDFRSLQKLKRTTSSDLNDINCGCNQSSTDSQHNLLLFGGETCLGNFRSDNWVLSKTVGMTGATNLNSENHQNNSVERMDSSKFVEGSRYFDLSVSVQPMSLGSLATGKHVMYLPNQTAGREFKRQQSVAETTPIRPPPSKNLLNKYDNSLEDLFCKNIPVRNKRFSFQSSVRQIERRRLAEKLSKDADQKEALRKSELEAMRRVEEEFQKKRAYEKASIRHQLRLYSMDDDNFISLPNLVDYRAEPDGAVSSASELSPILLTPKTDRTNL